jgi:hypothetical protein
MTRLLGSQTGALKTALFHCAHPSIHASFDPLNLLQLVVAEGHLII